MLESMIPLVLVAPLNVGAFLCSIPFTIAYCMGQFESILKWHLGVLERLDNGLVWVLASSSIHV